MLHRLGNSGWSKKPSLWDLHKSVFRAQHSWMKKLTGFHDIPYLLK